MSAKIQIIVYGMYGHVSQMAEAVAAGAREAGASEVSLWQVPELVPDERRERRGCRPRGLRPRAGRKNRRNWRKLTR